MNKIINIPELPLLKFFRAYLDVLSPFPPISTLSNKEKEFVALIMYYNNIYKELPKEDRYKLIFSTGKRKEMQTKLITNEAVFNNMKSSLRKKGIITQEDTLSNFYDIQVDNTYSITFNFKINGNISK